MAGINLGGESFAVSGDEELKKIREAITSGQGYLLRNGTHVQLWIPATEAVEFRFDDATNVG